MKQHFGILGQFKALHAKDTPATADANQRSVHLSPVSDNDKLLSLQMALKLSDLGHLAASREVHMRWVQALEEEFFLQGDAERAAGLPISPLCDRTKVGVTKSQVGFFGEWAHCVLFAL